LYVQIILKGKYAVMTGEDADGETTQFRRPDETLAGIVGSFHKDHARIAHEQTPETRRRDQNTKRDEGTTRIIPRIVVAEQWLCFLLGLIGDDFGLRVETERKGPP
jgi:hypothetical protein